MKELQSIIHAYRECEQNGMQAALATVVKVTGSAYRRPGARMLVTADGRTVGSVSGGCLERDAVNQARRVLQWHVPRVVTYDSMSDGDGVWEFKLGCNGIVDVLIEPLSCTEGAGCLRFLAHCLAHRQTAVVATIIAVEGRTKVQVGNRLLLSDQRPEIHDIMDDECAEALVSDSRCALASCTSRTNVYDMAACRVEAFIEVIQPSVALVIFGAGHDAIPLIRFAKELGWHVTLVDPRPGYATRTRFLLADELIVCRPEEALARIKIDKRTVAAVMTHSVLHDAEALRALLPLPLRYIGLLGPKGRNRRLLNDAQENGLVVSDPGLARMYGPIGLDIGAETPEEIALAVVAEINAVLTGRVGGLSRNRRGSLHEPNEAMSVMGSGQ
jgi:xanthine/CO dehydrogenase XdhC/CoxF family maturation factor